MKRSDALERWEGEEMGLWKSDILREYMTEMFGWSGNFEIVVFDILLLTRPKVSRDSDIRLTATLRSYNTHQWKKPEFLNKQATIWTTIRNRFPVGNSRGHQIIYGDYEGKKTETFARLVCRTRNACNMVRHSLSMRHSYVVRIRIWTSGHKWFILWDCTCKVSMIE